MSTHNMFSRGNKKNTYLDSFIISSFVCHDISTIYIVEIWENLVLFVCIEVLRPSQYT